MVIIRPKDNDTWTEGEAVLILDFLEAPFSEYEMTWSQRFPYILLIHEEPPLKVDEVALAEQLEGAFPRRTEVHRIAAGHRGLYVP